MLLSIKEIYTQQHPPPSVQVYNQYTQIFPGITAITRIQDIWILFEAFYRAFISDFEYFLMQCETSSRQCFAFVFLSE